MGRSERGRFACAGRRGLDAGIVTGEGESEGSFSSFSISGSLSSSSFAVVGWGRGTGKLIERAVRRDSDWARASCCGGFFMITAEVLAGLRDMDGRASAGLSLRIVPASSPRCLAASTRSLSSGGMRAWIEVMSLAWREKDS